MRGGFGDVAPARAAANKGNGFVDELNSILSERSRRRIEEEGRRGGARWSGGRLFWRRRSVGRTRRRVEAGLGLGGRREERRGRGQEHRPVFGGRRRAPPHHGPQGRRRRPGEVERRAAAGRRAGRRRSGTPGGLLAPGGADGGALPREGTTSWSLGGVPMARINHTKADAAARARSKGGRSRGGGRGGGGRAHPAASSRRGAWKMTTKRACRRSRVTCRCRWRGESFQMTQNTAVTRCLSMF